MQEVVLSAAKEATAYQRRLAAAEDAEMMKKFDPARNEVIRLTDAERGAFIEAVEPVLRKYREQFGPEQLARLNARRDNA
jgi:TRAP-type C4-dicarboxylate transport system substrate-binding protein